MDKTVLSINFQSVCVLLLLFHQKIEIVAIIREAQLRQILVHWRQPFGWASSNSLFHTNYGKMVPTRDNDAVGSYRHRTYNMITKIVTGNPYMHHSRDIYQKTSIFPRQPFWTFE